MVRASFFAALALGAFFSEFFATADPLVGPYSTERTTVDVPGLWLNEGTTDV